MSNTALPRDAALGYNSAHDRILCGGKVVAVIARGVNGCERIFYRMGGGADFEIRSRRLAASIAGDYRIAGESARAARDAGIVHLMVAALETGELAPLTDEQIAGALGQSKAARGTGQGAAA